MKIKTIVTTMLVVGTFGATAVAEPNYRAASMMGTLEQVTKVKQISQLKRNSSSVSKAAQEVYFSVNAHEGNKRYIVRLQDDSAASYRGGVKGFEAVNLSAKKSLLNNVPFNPKSAAANKYVAYLDKQQNSFIAQASSNLGHSISKLRTYKYAINGLVTELSFADAQKLAKMPQVAFIQQDKMLQLQTDTGPAFIGADNIWDGTAGTAEFRGEGVIIGMLDTGVNTDHRSFAATGDDGYTVVNPFGADTYVGDCVTNASLCNSKLIGVHSYSEITDVYSDAVFPPADQRPAEGEDHNGHGSHTSSTAGGNALIDVPYTVNDPASGNTGDGTETSLVFANMSGVAPHANIISYQVCFPGDSGDSFSGCPQSATIAAIDDAITDGVDVINYSIGGPGPSPWQDATDVGFLSAQAAGVFVATSAGNDGPDAATTTTAAPWYTSVAASTHGRIIGPELVLDGSSYIYAEGDGPALTAAVTAPIVYAGDVDAANFEGCNAFAAGSFTASIAFISRGACAFTDKINNAEDAGATAVVVFNNTDGNTLVNMSTSGGTNISAVFVSENSGQAMLDSIAATAGLSVDINLTPTTAIVQSDTIASFSSRGPNPHTQIITPQIAAPGVGVYAAYADDKPFSDGNTPDPSDFAVLSGTSMASPHIAGSGALLTQAHPTWNPDQIRSALMLTSTTAVLKEDGATAADPFDMGAGRVQVDEAINAGLVLSESEANYLAADPAAGGDPRTLNIPSMANFACGGSCSWTRAFTTINAGTYAFSSADTLLTMAPETVDATAGETFSVTFSMAVTTLSNETERFAQIDIASAASPDMHMPVYVKVNNGNVPDKVDIKAGRDNGSYALLDLQSIATDDLKITLNGLFDANATGLVESADFDIAVDPTNDTYDDDLSQVFVFEFEVSPNAASLNVRIDDSTSTDNDLFVEFDPNGDGGWVLSASSATAAANEQISVETPQAGKYRAIVQNWASTSGLATDTGTLSVEVVPITDPLPGLTVEAPTSTDGISPLGARLVWDREMSVGDSFFGDVTVEAGDLFLGNFPITIERVADDVTIASSTEAPVARGDLIDYTVTVNRNLYQDVMDYTLSVDMPEGSSLEPGSVVVSDGDVVVKDPNAVGLSLEEAFDIPEDPTNDLYSDDLSQVFVLGFDVPNATLDMKIAITAATSPDNDLYVEISDGAGNWSLVAFSASGETLESVIIDAPEVGTYRAIVQNWAGSAAASDTGTLTVNLTPAKGEGFIWSATSALSFDTFNVVSSADEAMCADAGFGGYTPLEGFGIGTAGATGDTVTFSAFAGTNFSFYGNDHDGISFTDDGFAILSGTSGSNPWVNFSIPNSAEPNDMIAMFWKDLEIFDDRDPADANDIGTRGVRLASAGGGTVPIIDFDEMGSFADDTDRFSFELFAFTEATDAPGDYEYIVAYSDAQVGDFTGAVAGVENADGSDGVDASSLIQPGVQLCYDAVKGGDSFDISFSVRTTAASVGNPITPTVLVQTTLPGSSDWNIDGAPVALVNVAPIANAGADITYNRGELTVGQINLDGSATVDLDKDQLLFVWTQTGGGDIPLHGAGTGRPFFNLSEAPNDSYTFSVTVSDGEFSDSDEVTVTIEGTSAVGGLNGGLGGSMGGILLVIMGITFFSRRRFLK